VHTVDQLNRVIIQQYRRFFVVIVVVTQSPLGHLPVQVPQQPADTTHHGRDGARLVFFDHWCYLNDFRDSIYGAIRIGDI
jgi:hypothetical protein